MTGGDPMARVVVLGGCGVVGSVAVQVLAAQDVIGEVVIADRAHEKASMLASRLGSKKVRPLRVDVSSPEETRSAIRGADIVLNCVGPFFSTVEGILDAAIDERVNYVDICDDVDATLKILEKDEKARREGVTALIGMGSSPGATNLLARLAHDMLLDTTSSVDIFHTHGGEPVEGEGVIGHRFHCMSIDIPMYLDGRFTTVKFFGQDGIALRQTFDFPMVGKGIPIFPYPHPEQVTLPRHLKLSRVTNKGSVLPIEYFNLIMAMVELDLASTDPVTVNGVPVVPRDFAISFILRERGRILEKTGFTKPCGCCSVVVRGTKDSSPLEYRFHLASRTQALGEGTGVPAAIAVMLMAMGKVKGPGVLPPEACVNPMDFVDLVPKVMRLDHAARDPDSFGGVIVERVDAEGVVTRVDI